VAGEYHQGATLICSDCHTMHASLQHSYGGGSTGFPVSWEPSEFLLKGGFNETCLSCHNDTSGIPDVYGADSGAMVGDRAAGGLNDVAGAFEGYDSYMGHTLGSTDAAPGDTGSFVPEASHGLVCIDCHLQHGRATGTDVAGNAVSSPFRNFTVRGGVNVSYALGTNVAQRDIFIPSNDYSTANVQLNEPVATNSGIAQWCQGCHVNFHGDVGDPDSIGGSGTPPSDFIRHPAATANIGAVGGGHSALSTFTAHLYRVRVMSSTGNWGTQGVAWTGAPTDLTPTCVSCHKGHGNQRPFGLIYALGNSALGENGDGTQAKELCKQCHRQG
jgi:hypothetical protein